MRASRIWNAFLALVVLVAMIIQIVLVIGGGTDVNAVTTEGDPGPGTRLIRLFSYFTIQSNLLVLASAALIAWRPDGDGPFQRVLRLDALLGIVVTGLVYETVLAPLVHPTGLALWITIAFHYFAPWFTTIGWLLFGPRPRIDDRTLLLAFIWPALWIAYTFAHGAASDWYPYPFLDVTDIGYARALRNTAVVLLGAAVLALAFAWLDRRLPVWSGGSWVRVRNADSRE
jgi:hypothetical protein